METAWETAQKFAVWRQLSWPAASMSIDRFDSVRQKLTSARQLPVPSFSRLPRNAEPPRSGRAPGRCSARIRRSP
ncbi:hypothetical protein ACFYOK_10405 [Microbispora bryophytorum]|uniref:hypothetical protein n=1 Tax=Microbispora bryophytorum TaxID=1460882 RepID=UPI0033C1C97F